MEGGRNRCTPVCVLYQETLGFVNYGGIFLKFKHEPRNKVVVESGNTAQRQQSTPDSGLDSSHSQSRVFETFKVDLHAGAILRTRIMLRVDLMCAIYRTWHKQDSQGQILALA